MEIKKNKKDRNFMCWFYFSKIGKTICKLERLFKNLTNNQYKTYLALIGATAVQCGKQELP
jgi:hypothetical protein